MKQTQRWRIVCNTYEIGGNVTPLLMMEAALCNAGTLLPDHTLLQVIKQHSSRVI